MSKDRGFKKLKGVTISKVDASCVNVVSLLDEDGKHCYTIEAVVENGIPVLTLERRKVKPSKSTADKKFSGKLEGTWPFPTEKDQSLD